MKITLRQNKTDTNMIEMWSKIGNMPYLMAVAHVDNFTDLVDHLDELDGETVVEMKVIDNE